MNLILKTMSQETPPTEQELRDHFGDKLPPDMVVERIPHTTVWATNEGVLLWDWRNGYADLSPEEGKANELLAECLRFLTEDAQRLNSREKYRLIAKLKIQLRR